MDKLHKSKSSNQVGLELFFILSGWIAIPVILALFLGKWLDVKFGTEPTFTFICIGIAFIATIIGIARKGIKMMKEAEAAEKNMNKDKTPDS